MRRLFLLTFLISVPAPVVAQAPDPLAADREAVRSAVLNYVEAIPPETTQAAREEMARVSGEGQAGSQGR